MILNNKPCDCRKELSNFTVLKDRLQFYFFHQSLFEQCSIFQDVTIFLF
jgi:hypothetical protein